ncbi:MAG: hypothetical protein SFU27_01730 [Thermonemataceae bacterium]|nr:hypothetical protein [Thermonemataceae bacterium]
MKKLFVLLFAILSVSVSAQNLERLEIEGRLLSIKAYPLGYGKPTDMGRIEFLFLTPQGTEIKINHLGVCALTNDRRPHEFDIYYVKSGFIEDGKIYLDYGSTMYAELEKGKSYKLKFQQICFSQLAGNALAYEKYAIYNPSDCQGFTMREGTLWNYDDEVPNPTDWVAPGWSFFDKDGKIYLLVAWF